jgi:4-amino-4-deoxy-L-arabinose transferase-like glycosyltransferase
MNYSSQAALIGIWAIRPHSSMDANSAEHFLKSKYVLWIVGILTIIFLLITNLPWNLDDYDQAKQAFTSFEMVKEGHWLYQRTPHERLATKPPLIGWISAGFFTVTRSWNVAWRLPSLLAAGALSFLLFRSARSAYGIIAGMIALSAFGFNLLSPRLATLVRTDMPLALVIFLIGLLIWQKIRENAPWRPGDRLQIFGLLTAGMLIKGPIVYAFLLPGIVLFQWWRRRSGAASAWSGWWPWVASLGVFLIWVIGGIQFVPRFYDQVVMREFLGRFGTTMHHPKEFYFYLPHLLHKFAPWSILIIVLAWLYLRSDKSQIRTVFNRISPETFWLICWSLGGVVVMSLIPSKRVDRIFPVIPPLCLLLGAQIGIAPLSHQLRQWFYRWSMAALCLSILFTGCYTAFKIVSGYRDHRDALVKFGRAVCEAAANHHWRYEAISGSDEGMLLYLQKLHFIEPGRAVAAWNGGTLDALVVPAEAAVSYLGSLRNASLSPLQSTEKRDERGKGYLLLTH